MFAGCIVFNKSVSTFDTSQVTDMSGMFRVCDAFNQHLFTFNTSKVTNMKNMLC